MIKVIGTGLVVAGVLVCALASSAPAATTSDHQREPIACLKNGAECTGYGCCSHTCVQSRCVP